MSMDVFAILSFEAIVMYCVLNVSIFKWTKIDTTADIRLFRLVAFEKLL